MRLTLLYAGSQMRQLVFSPQTFIVRFFTIGKTQDRHIYTQTERRGKGLAAGETESVLEMESG